MTLPPQLQSKKLWATMLGVVLIPIIGALNHKLNLGLSTEDIAALVGLMAAYVLGQGIADAGTKGMTSGVAQAYAKERAAGGPPSAPTAQTP